MKYPKKFKNRLFFGGGIILYHNGKILMQKTEDRDYWEDFGGKTDKEDSSVIETAYRECEEESNQVITKEFLSEMIDKNPDKCHYLLQSNSYFIYLIFVSRKDKEYLKSKNFGKMEKHDKIKREVSWIDPSEELHPRIKYLHKYLKKK